MKSADSGKSLESVVQEFHDSSPLFFQFLILLTVFIATYPCLIARPLLVTESELQSLMHFFPEATSAAPYRMAFLGFQAIVSTLVFGALSVMFGRFRPIQIHTKFWAGILILGIGVSSTQFGFDIQLLVNGLVTLAPVCLGAFALASLFLTKINHLRLAGLLFLFLIGKTMDTRLELVTYPSLLKLPANSSIHIPK